jgi:hypothetical protein
MRFEGVIIIVQKPSTVLGDAELGQMCVEPTKEGDGTNQMLELDEYIQSGHKVSLVLPRDMLSCCRFLLFKNALGDTRQFSRSGVTSRKKSTGEEALSAGYDDDG